MLRKAVAVIVLVPLAIVIIAFAVANRQTVTMSFDPFSAGEPAASLTLPLFALLIVVLIVGVIIGGMASWLRQGRWRSSARRFERELQRLRDKLAAFESSAAPQANASLQANPPERLRLRPPAR